MTDLDKIIAWLNVVADEMGTDDVLTRRGKDIDGQVVASVGDIARSAAREIASYQRFYLQLKEALSKAGYNDVNTALNELNQIKRVNRAAIRDLQDVIRRKTKRCAVCMYYKDKLYFHPQKCPHIYELGCNGIWRGPCAENGGNYDAQ